MNTVLHRWTEVTAETLKPGVIRRAFHTDGMTVARLQLAAGSIVPRHSHVNEQITNVEQGRLVFLFDDERVEVSAGESLAILPNVSHAVEALEDSVALDLFTPRREDWIQGDDAYLRR